MVIRHAFKVGIPWRGLMHDLSKYTPTEFGAGIKYYAGGKFSANENERKALGYSKAWVHHKGRNRHHFEYWTDYVPHTKKLMPIKMPKKFVIEMFCDRVAASKIYQGEKIGIIGYNGAGKSTLLRVITGIYTPDNGEVITRGNISPLLSLGAGFDRNYSGRKNIYLNGAILGFTRKQIKEKMESAQRKMEQEQRVFRQIRKSISVCALAIRRPLPTRSR